MYECTCTHVHVEIKYNAFVVHTRVCTCMIHTRDVQYRHILYLYD